MQTITIDGEDFEIPDGWFLGYLIECTPSGYYYPPLTYYGPRKNMWRAYEIRKNLLTLRTFSPNKGKKMNVTPNTNTVDGTYNVAKKPYYIDAEGNRVEIPFDIEGDNDGQTYSGSEAASAEATEISEADRTDGSAVVYVATDEADHPVTVH